MDMMKRWFALLTMIVLGVVLGTANYAQAQDNTAQQEEEKIALEKKAGGLLEQVATESAGLRLAENRVRLQTIMGDLLWTRNEGQARSMFDTAATSLMELIRVATVNRASNRRGNDQRFNRVMTLRQELRSEERRVGKECRSRW